MAKDIGIRTPGSPTWEYICFKHAIGGMYRITIPSAPHSLVVETTSQSQDPYTAMRTVGSHPSTLYNYQDSCTASRSGNDSTLATPERVSNWGLSLGLYIAVLSLSFHWLS